VKVILYCLLCDTKAEFEDSGIGWANADDIEYGGALCPKHAAVMAFKEAQCPGRVASFGTECPMFRSFAYSARRTITEDDLVQIERGTCPQRVNGTFSVSVGRVEQLDISEQAPTEGGRAFAYAIRDYIERYPSK
jgi:hypothetical protein